MKKENTVVVVIAYLFALLIGLIFLTYKLNTVENDFLKSINLVLNCLQIGGFGGVLYCLRGVYLNYSVRKRWSNEWLPWYFIRPVISVLCGGVSFLFLKAGLLVLEAEKEADASNLGFFALSFIAGMNVDKFISKIEDLAQATWGIEKSRASKDENKT